MTTSRDIDHNVAVGVTTAEVGEAEKIKNRLRMQAQYATTAEMKAVEEFKADIRPLIDKALAQAKALAAPLAELDEIIKHIDAIPWERTMWGAVSPEVNALLRRVDLLRGIPERMRAVGDYVDNLTHEQLANARRRHRGYLVAVCKEPDGALDALAVIKFQLVAALRKVKVLSADASASARIDISQDILDAEAVKAEYHGQGERPSVIGRDFNILGGKQ